MPGSAAAESSTAGSVSTVVDLEATEPPKAAPHTGAQDENEYKPT